MVFEQNLFLYDNLLLLQTMQQLKMDNLLKLFRWNMLQIVCFVPQKLENAFSFFDWISANEIGFPEISEKVLEFLEYFCVSTQYFFWRFQPLLDILVDSLVGKSKIATTSKFWQIFVAYCSASKKSVSAVLVQFSHHPNKKSITCIVGNWDF